MTSTCSNLWITSLAPPEIISSPSRESHEELLYSHTHHREMSSSLQGTGKKHIRHQDVSLSSPVLRLSQRSSVRQSLPKTHTTSGSQPYKRRTYWDTVLDKSPSFHIPTHTESKPLKPSATPIAPRVNITTDSTQQKQTAESSSSTADFGKESITDESFTEMSSEFRQRAPSKPFGCHLCKGRFERIGHLKVRLLHLPNVCQIMTINDALLTNHIATDLLILFFRHMLMLSTGPVSHINVFMQHAENHLAINRASTGT